MSRSCSAVRPGSVTARSRLTKGCRRRSQSRRTASHAINSHLASPGPAPKHLTALADGVYEALREVFDVPQGDRFAVVHEHEPHGFIYDPHYLGVPRSDDLVIVEITCNDTRTTGQKQALYRAIAEKLGHQPGLRPEDIMIVLVEVKAENWSFGRGEAQYVKPQI